MPTDLDDVCRKFGEAAEAAQLLEHELGTILLVHRAVIEKAIKITDTGFETDPGIAIDILEKSTRRRLGKY